MSVKSRTIVAAVLAVLAVVCILAYAASVRGQASGEREQALERYGGETVSVCVASRPIAAGETFSERNVEVLEWLVDLLPEGALADSDEVIGKTAACAIAQNTPLASVHMESGSEPLNVPEGLVALSVPCTADTAVGGVLAAGATVDVYVVGDGSARPVAQGVQVLKTNVASGLGSLAWAVLAVAPDQVESLVAACAVQKAYLTLPSEEELAQRGDLQVSRAEQAVADGLVQAYGTPEDAAQTAGTGDATAEGAGADAADVVSDVSADAAAAESTGDVEGASVVAVEGE